MCKEEADLIRTQAGTYEIMEQNRDGWNLEAFKERYSDILDKYDYIVGDWGYGQLRLRGFYADSNRKVPFEQRIAALDEYLHEFCNFGCPYFVLKKVKPGVGNPHGSDDAQDNLVIDIWQEGGRDEIPGSYGERKDRRRFQPRHNKQERTEKNASERHGNSRHERSDKPKFSKEKPDRNARDAGPDRRSNQQRPNRERDKVPTGPNSPKRDS